jgi:hypothetical protein
MAGIPDRAYNAACGRLASALGVSLAAARRRVDIKAAQAGLHDTAAKLALAEELLTEAQANSAGNQALLSSLLEAVSSEENFMTED